MTTAIILLFYDLQFCHMGVIFILILVSLIVAIGFLIAFIWAVKDGQYEDDYGPSVRMLFDDTKYTKSNELTNDSPISNKK